MRAYYDAGARLNAGLPLYPPDADPNAPDFYRYPPLLAIAFRPLALLPYSTAAAIWAAIVVASVVATLWWLGVRRRETWIAAGILASPIAWCVAVGQAQAPLTFLTALGAPWAIALGANLKLFPRWSRSGGSAVGNGGPLPPSRRGRAAWCCSSSSWNRRRRSTSSAR